MPCNFSDFHTRGQLAGAEFGVFLDTACDIPHYRIKTKSRRHHKAPDFNPIYDVVDDPQQQNPIRDVGLESELAGKMRQLLERFDAPECQYARAGL